MKSKENYVVRKAVIDDIPLLVSHHSLMFREIRTLQGKEIKEESYKKMEEAQAEKLQNEMPKGLCHAWIVDDENKIAVASGAISLYSFTASPEDPSYIGAYVHSIWTEKQHRGNKLSTRIINETISFCREKGISKMCLIASDAGKPIYEAMGFEAPVTTFMSLTV